VASKVLEVKNESMETQNYRFLSPDKESVLAKSIDINPPDFRLAPGEAKSVVLRFHQPKESSQENLRLVAYGPHQESKLAIGSGVIIPVQFIAPKPQVNGASVIKTGNGSQFFWHMIVYMLDALALILFIWFTRFRPNRILVKRARHKISFI